MSHTKKQQKTGLTALLLVSFIYGFTGIIARYFNRDGMSIYQQLYIRLLPSVVFGFYILRGKIDFSKIRRLTKRDTSLLFIRSFIGYIIGLSLFSLAAQNAKIGVVSLMQSIPITTLIGILIFKERLNLGKTFSIILSFIGVVFVSVDDFSDFKIGYGALLSLISAIAFSFSYVMRRWHTKLLNDYEISMLNILFGFVYSYLISLVIDRRFWPVLQYTLPFVVLIILSGFLNILINVLSNIGFDRVKITLAGTIMQMEQVYGPIFGWIFYREILNHREIGGGLMILVSVYALNHLSKTKQNRRTS